MPANFLSRTILTARSFMRTWGNPEQAYAAREQDVRSYRYQRLWDMYQGTAFNDMAVWAEYRRAYALYRQTRVIWDHVHQLVEFYATHIWSGSLADDGLHLPNGVPNAIPLAEDTDETLAKAIGQLWLWWNFQEVMTMIVRYTAALGECLVELKDDPARGKILIDIIWPSYVRDIRLDEAGNVKYYCIEYNVLDEKTKITFLYKREVDAESFRTYRDNEPYDYVKNPLPVGTEPHGEAAHSFSLDYSLTTQQESGEKIDNPYGFAPAVWFRHYRMIGVRGEPAVWATQAELDEINQLFSHMLDKAHVSLEAPIVVSGNIAPNALSRALTNMVGSVKRTFTEDLSEPRGDSESLNILEGPAGTEVKTIELKISEAAEALDRIVAGIERKCPEITFYQQLRAMTQLTGPAASRVLGDVDRKVRAIASGYDRRLISLQQMGISMAAMRVAEGLEGWAEKSEEQKKFSGFDENSFKAGKLNHNIMPREIVPMSPRDRYELLQLKRTVLDIIPQVQLAKEGGYDEELVEKWQQEWEKQQDEKLKQEQEMMAMKAPTPFAPRRGPGAPEGGPQRGSSVQKSGNRGNIRAVR